MKSLYESILKTNNASIENDLLGWCKSKFNFDDLPMYCEKYKDGYNIIIDSFEHQPQIGGINLTEEPPKYLRGIYYMKYDTIQSKGVRTPVEIRIGNIKGLDNLDFSDYHFEIEKNNKFSIFRNVFQIQFCSIKSITGMPSTNEKSFYKIQQCNISKMEGLKCPNVTLEMYDGNSINPFNINKCIIDRLVIDELTLGSGLSQILRDKTFGSSTFDSNEYIRHGNIFEMCKEYQYIVDHLLTHNQINTLQIWENPGKDREQMWYVYKHKQYGYCLKRG